MRSQTYVNISGTCSKIGKHDQQQELGQRLNAPASLTQAGSPDARPPRGPNSRAPRLAAAPIRLRTLAEGGLRSVLTNSRCEIFERRPRSLESPLVSATNYPLKGSKLQSLGPFFQRGIPKTDCTPDSRRKNRKVRGFDPSRFLFQGGG